MRSSQIQILDAWITVEQLSEGNIEKSDSKYKQSSESKDEPPVSKAAQTSSTQSLRDWLGFCNELDGRLKTEGGGESGNVKTDYAVVICVTRTQ